jgi:hypothetical protein
MCRQTPASPQTIQALLRSPTDCEAASRASPILERLFRRIVRIAALRRHAETMVFVGLLRIQQLARFLAAHLSRHARLITILIAAAALRLPVGRLRLAPG